jgi:hypothetical protein
MDPLLIFGPWALAGVLAAKALRRTAARWT